MGIRADIAHQLTDFLYDLEIFRWSALTWPPSEWNRASARTLLCWQEGQALVTVRGELDDASAPELADLLTNEVCVRGPRRLVLDLSGVSFIDCAGLRAIARARRLLPPECPVVLRSPSRAARKLLAATGLDSVYPIEDASG